MFLSTILAAVIVFNPVAVGSGLIHNVAIAKTVIEIKRDIAISSNSSLDALFSKLKAERAISISA